MKKIEITNTKPGVTIQSLAGRQKQARSMGKWIHLDLKNNMKANNTKLKIEERMYLQKLLLGMKLKKLLLIKR
jgi:hypothetical protein